MKRIVIVEDNLSFAKGFEFLISYSERYIVTHIFSTCEEAIREIEKIHPDIIIMDVDLPGINGIEGTKRIKQLLPQVDILVVTVFENSEKVFDSLAAGATGYITKNSGSRQILDALDELMNGGAPMSANIARMVVRSFRKDKKPEILTDRETQILQLLSIGKSYKTISKEISVSLDTVKFHIKNIYLKMQVSNKEDAISKARINNWV